MKRICDLINERHNASAFHSLLQNLDAMSFASSWKDDPQSDCLVTLHYSRRIEDEECWRTDACTLLQSANLQQVTGRSRGVVMCAVPGKMATVRDTIYMARSKNTGESRWSVVLSEQQAKESMSRKTPLRAVHYLKPEGAFAHPNGSVMCQALSWILSRIDLICEESIDEVRMVELYSGFGAHSLAIQRANITKLVEITAVELDRRLTNAFHQNIELNTKTSCSSISNTDLKIIQGDATKWARNRLLQQSTSSDNKNRRNFIDILLVDPPRNGLDRHVRELLLSRNDIVHCLYISCGTEALVRDMSVLLGASDKSSFVIRDCLVLDLFPQTSAVETLLHLEKRVSL